MTIEVQVQDSEQLVVDFLRPLLLADEFTCGRRVPDDWDTSMPGHVQVVADGESDHVWPVLVNTGILLVARAESLEAASDLCGRALSLLLAHPGDNRGISGVLLKTGVVPDVDEKTKVPIATAAVRVTVRTLQVF